MSGHVCQWPGLTWDLWQWLKKLMTQIDPKSSLIFVCAYDSGVFFLAYLFCFFSENPFLEKTWTHVHMTQKTALDELWWPPIMICLQLQSSRTETQDSIWDLVLWLWQIPTNSGTSLLAAISIKRLLRLFLFSLDCWCLLCVVVREDKLLGRIFKPTNYDNYQVGHKK